MKKVLLLLIVSLTTTAISFAQTASQRIQKAMGAFENDGQLKHALISLYVIDAKTGEVLYDKNSQIGMAGASTQKVITASTAFELLGKDYRYPTQFWKLFETRDERGPVFVVVPAGDPTFGSSRFKESSPENIFRGLSAAIKKESWEETVLQLYRRSFDAEKIPDGWIWQDIGNYYGAGTDGFNWKENQSDIVLKAGDNKGDSVSILSVDSSVGIMPINNQLKTGAKGSGDNAYYYFYYGNSVFSFPVVKGTIPAGEKRFKISVAVADPFSYFIADLQKKTQIGTRPLIRDFMHPAASYSADAGDSLVYTHYSPSLDSIVYWFLKKSINLYGEALVKTFAYRQNGFGSTDSGTAIVKKFWSQKGIDKDELNIYDGSGLSPLNRITTHAQVEVLKFAKSRDWFPYFYDALPEYNGMKMKSGTISDVKGFCGYQKSKDGHEYIFSFLVNNYSGSSVTTKMFKVLDELK